ncbi:glycoside hydrolase family 2 protein [Pseudobacter ginsenosidimutans]|uniref:glycoside hydrolase family 2 protein n=1 Tax=Pseudobacter ginsenosidimutans TaxID=661488 RepID=UPI001CEFAE4E|nr:glycoside hydrolase family 2 TIM barrel-domain containing protein [Pseudobacter ginsenosidimutans]
MKRTLVVFLVMAMLTGSTKVKAQQSVRLNHNWEFLKQDLGGIWEAIRPVGKGNPESVPLWTSVTLPHCVNASDGVDPDQNYYQGPAWYRTQLTIANPYPKGRTILHFEGSGQKTSVYVYDQLVKTHVGGYDEFKVDITDAVEAFRKNPAYQKQFSGKIPVSIRTDNSRDLEMIPSSLSDFNIYGGIYRYLNLVYLPAVSFDKVHVKAEVDKEGKMGKLTINTNLYEPTKSTGNSKILIRLMDPSGKAVSLKTAVETSASDRDAGLGGPKEMVFEFKKPRLWSTDNPELYTVEVILQTASAEIKETVKTGFRNFEFVEQGPFLLNGKRLLLRGTHRHEDHAGVGAAMTEEIMRKEMIMMKEMGVNFIRLGHYQQSRIILQLCDSLGIVVWEEIPWCRGGLGGEVYKEQARRMLKNMIAQHYNHPSVIIWGWAMRTTGPAISRSSIKILSAPS